MVEKGSGPALVLVPGLPGPWQFIRPAIDALAGAFRVLTMSLGPECTIESDVDRIVAALDERHIDHAIICGISFGGLVALRFAATYPKRTAALVLASTPGPGTRLRPRHHLYARWPYVFGPLFVLEAPFRLRRELRWPLLRTALTTRISFSQMAKRARLIESTDIAADCHRVTAPTLVVTGEPSRDHVVRVNDTERYLSAIRGAEHVVLTGTGHLGTVTHPGAFAVIIKSFVGRPSPRTEVA